MLPVVSSSAIAQAAIPAVLLSLVVILIFHLFFNGSDNKTPSPPVVPGLPIIGGLLKFMKGPVDLVSQYYPELGSVFSVKLFHQKITFLIGPEVSSHFFRAPEDQLSQQEVYGYSARTFGNDVVFAVPYSVRMEQFRFFADSLKTTRLRTYTDMMVHEAKEFFSKWGDEGEIDLKEEMANLIILTASRCLLGKEVREQMFERVHHLFHELDEGMIPISVVAPWLPIKPHRRRDVAREELRKIFSQIIKKRIAAGTQENDMLQVFIDSTYRATGRKTTEGEVTGMLIAALFGGQHTSSLTAAWIGTYLMTRKNFASAVVEEQKEIVKKHKDLINYDVLNEMDCLHRFIKETLRLHPPLIMLLRYNNAPFTVKSKEGKEYTVAKKDIVATCPTYHNRLPYIYTKPDEFDPDRFAAGREEDKFLPFSYLAFGGGRHGCMGESFAHMQLKTIWSILVREYDFELLSPFPVPDYSLLVVGPKGKVMVRYKKKKITET